MAKNDVRSSASAGPSEARAGWLGRHERKVWVAIACLLAPFVAHSVIGVATQIDPPVITPPSGLPVAAAGAGDLVLLGPAYARHTGKILEVRLAGSPEAIGDQHARLLSREMTANEEALYADFARYVPFPPLRWLLMDVSQIRFRNIDQAMPAERRREIAAQAMGFQPDPFEDVLPTYHRFVFLQALYDIALSFEHSPLLGCTSFALTGGAFEGGHVVLARNFDFEAGPIFDEGKAVFLVLEEGRIPYASVAWPGFVGAVTGMNAEGLALVVHGARAREPQSEGEPVVHTTRELLGRARTTAEAVALLQGKQTMVSHLLMLVDAAGDVAIAERAPGEPLYVRRAQGKVALTNHFEGPLADDPANRRIEAVTSTRPRRLRLDELLVNLPERASVERVVKVLRDRKGVGGKPLPLGHRHAIDALIATHAVVMDATARLLWVSEGPHLLGRWLRFDLARLLAPDYKPQSASRVIALAADDMMKDGTYDAWLRSGSPHSGGQ